MSRLFVNLTIIDAVLMTVLSIFFGVGVDIGDANVLILMNWLYYTLLRIPSKLPTPHLSILYCMITNLKYIHPTHSLTMYVIATRIRYSIT